MLSTDAHAALKYIYIYINDINSEARAFIHTYFLYWIAYECFFELLQPFNYNPNDKVILYLFLWLSKRSPAGSLCSIYYIFWAENSLVNPLRQISTHLFRFHIFKPFLYVFLHKFLKVAQKENNVLVDSKAQTNYYQSS